MTESEIAPIPQLEGANTLVRSQSSLNDGLELVGAIRDYTSCLECHNVHRGDTLGVFTYQFDITINEATVESDRCTNISVVQKQSWIRQNSLAVESPKGYTVTKAAHYLIAVQKKKIAKQGSPMFFVAT